MRPTLLALASFLALATAQAATVVHAPALSVGDFFEVRDLIVPDDGASSSRTFRQTVEALEPLTLNGQTFDAAKLVGRFVGAQGPAANGTITMWVRASDGALLKEVVSFRGSDDVRTYETPCVRFQFPMSVGDQWISVCHAHKNNSTTDIKTNIAYQVLRAGTLQVPAGTFDAYEIQHTNEFHPSAPIHSWYAPKACTIARTLEDSRGYNDTYDLMAYKCARTEDAGGAVATKPAPAPALPLVALAIGGAAVVLAGRRGR